MEFTPNLIPFLLPTASSAQQKVMSASPLSGGNTSSSLTGDNTVFGAFGSLLGYIGAEAVTTASFEDLLWPQRSLSNFTVSKVAWQALLMPMGGPMHKAALNVFDIVYRHGLLKGRQQGHMLGTAFFPELGWAYTMYSQGLHEEHTEPLRNCILARALCLLPMPELDQSSKSSNPGSVEGAISSPYRKMERVRSKVRVSHLTIAKATETDKRSSLPFVCEQHGTPGPRVLLGICVSELSAIGITIVVAALFHSPWALIWLVPLALRLLSAVFAVERESLVHLTSSTSATDPPCDFEVHCPQSEGNFLLISGPPTLVLQFARHYGHPKRDRLREVIQLFVVIMFGLLFPLQIVCSTIWMPVSLQNIWLCYQLYVVLAMLVSRYSGLGSGSTTSTALANALSKEGFTGREFNKSEHAILFGHTRNGPETLKRSGRGTYGQDEYPKYSIPAIPGRWELGSDARSTVGALPVHGTTWKIPRVDAEHVTVEKFQTVVQTMGEDGIEWAWSDIACIDQEDEVVKSDEVGRQASVFSRESTTFVWLSRLSKEILMNSMRPVSDAAGDWRLDRAAIEFFISGSPTIHQAILTILAEPWFSSLWTL
ncbi:hypothetical protein VMCG_05395 [Cytospora schulzeri]|uniref:Heterokaryon incompatibility domain-containing protein n=1 Tax=Cytospora schulzeri TaxID=448051 RepID=A0A423WKE8_9PEZI|nr:hypothetical protein VMCG_05395 [Valsa malicola]